MNLWQFHYRVQNNDHFHSKYTPAWPTVSPNADISAVFSFQLRPRIWRSLAYRNKPECCHFNLKSSCVANILDIPTTLLPLCLSYYPRFSELKIIWNRLALVKLQCKREIRLFWWGMRSWAQCNTLSNLLRRYDIISQSNPEARGHLIYSLHRTIFIVIMQDNMWLTTLPHLTNKSEFVVFLLANRCLLMPSGR